MMSVLESAWVIARRDFTATVFSRSFIFFLAAPLIVLGFSMLAGFAAARSAQSDNRPTVAVAADSATVQALEAARARLVRGTGEREFPLLRRVPQADQAEQNARALLADEAAGLSAVFSGTIDAPVLSAPERAQDFAGRRMGLIVEEAQREQALRAGNATFRPAQIRSDVVPEAAGNLTELRRGVARGGQFAVFFFTLLLAGMLLSNLVEEKSNKIIEILAAAVPLDAVFAGKLLAMLGVSLAGIAAWGAIAGLGTLLSVQLIPGLELPNVMPAVGWPVFAILILFYYTTNYMILGALFLGIGGQANSVREVQTLSMPITFLQMAVMLLATFANATDGSMMSWIAFIFPFSSPLAMVGFAAQSPLLWPHLLALAWQALWIVIIIRFAAGLFRKTVLKSGGPMGLMPKFGRRAKG